MSHPAEYYSDYPDAPVIPRLQRPLVITGPPGIGIKSVGAALCSLSGWPYVEIERLVEHDVGCAIAGLVSVEGLALVSARCWSQVYRALIRSPAAVIAVHAPILAHRPRLDELLARARMVYLDAEPADLFRHLEHQQTQSPGELAWFGRSAIELEAVRELVRESDPVRRAAHEVRRVRPEGALRSARAILADHS
jgi:shikimate kinase